MQERETFLLLRRRPHSGRRSLVQSDIVVVQLNAKYILRLGTQTVFSQDDKRLNLEESRQKLFSSFVSDILSFTLPLKMKLMRKCSLLLKIGNYSTENLNLFYI